MLKRYNVRNFLEPLGGSGLVVGGNCHLYIQAWEQKPRDFYTTEVSTSGPRQKYNAVTISTNSVATILDLTDLMGGGFPIIGKLKIIDTSLKAGTEYIGVKLDGRSALINAKNLEFSDPDVNDGEPTLPKEQEIFLADGESCVVVE